MPCPADQKHHNGFLFSNDQKSQRERGDCSLFSSQGKSPGHRNQGRPTTMNWDLTIPKPANNATPRMGRSLTGHLPERNLFYRGNDDPQLLQNSREDQKLTQMIHSWPTGSSSRGRSRETAADLLRGALDLRESLIMLGKLEEAYKYMERTSIEHDYHFTKEEGVVGKMGVKAMGSRRFHQHLLRPVERSSRNCVEDLKKVLRDGLHRQNLVSISSDDDEKPSPSSSQKLSTGDGAGCKQSQTTENLDSAAAQQLGARAPNLIARLMGLEEAPPEEFQPVRRAEMRRNSNHPGFSLEVEMPEVIKLPLEEAKPEPGRETLQGIRSGGVESPQIGSPVDKHVLIFPADDRVLPPVISRPVGCPSSEMEKMQEGRREGDHASVMGKSLSSKKTGIVESPALLVLPKRIESRAEKAVAEAKTDMSGKTRSPASSSHKQLKEEEEEIRMRKKPDGKQKPVVGGSASEENRSKRSTAASLSQIKRTSSMPRRKPEKGHHASTKNSSSHHEDDHPKRPARRNPTTGTAKGKTATRAKPVGKPIIVEQQVDDGQSSKQENEEAIPCGEKSILAVNCKLPCEDLLPKETDHHCITSTRDGREKKPRYHCEVLPKRSHGRVKLDPYPAPMKHPKRESTITVPAESSDHLKSLLLSSPDFFLRAAQELFSLDHRQPIASRRTVKEEDKRQDNSKLLLEDCAGELMICKLHHPGLSNHPTWMNCLKSAVPKISMNRLVEEITREMEKLGHHHSIGAGESGASGDSSLYARLERDLKWGGVFASGAWERGWSEAIPVEEADGVVCDVGNHILEALLEEIAREWPSSPVCELVFLPTRLLGLIPLN